MEPFGAEPGPRWRSRPAGQVVVLGAIVATAASFAPAIVPIVLLTALAWAVGAVVVGTRDPGWRLVVVALESIAVAALLAGPWVVGTALAGRASVSIFGLPVAGATAPGWGELLRFAVGPVARSPIVWLLVVGRRAPARARPRDPARVGGAAVGRGHSPRGASRSRRRAGTWVPSRRR